MFATPTKTHIYACIHMHIPPHSHHYLPLRMHTHIYTLIHNNMEREGEAYMGYDGMGKTHAVRTMMMGNIA